jgi:hypothetical protein
MARRGGVVMHAKKGKKAVEEVVEEEEEDEFEEVEEEVEVEVEEEVEETTLVEKEVVVDRPVQGMITSVQAAAPGLWAKPAVRNGAVMAGAVLGATLLWSVYQVVKKYRCERPGSPCLCVRVHLETDACERSWLVPTSACVPQATDTCHQRRRLAASLPLHLVDSAPLYVPVCVVRSATCRGGHDERRWLSRDGRELPQNSQGEAEAYGGEEHAGSAGAGGVPAGQPQHQERGEGPVRAGTCIHNRVSTWWRMRVDGREVSVR